MPSPLDDITKIIKRHGIAGPVELPVDRVDRWLSLENRNTSIGDKALRDNLRRAAQIELLHRDLAAAREENAKLLLYVRHKIVMEMQQRFGNADAALIQADLRMHALFPGWHAALAAPGEGAKAP